MELFEDTIFSYIYPPADMDDKEFTKLKKLIDDENKRIDLVEKFLKQNETFHNKKKLFNM